MSQFALHRRTKKAIRRSEPVLSKPILLGFAVAIFSCLSFPTLKNVYEQHRISSVDNHATTDTLVEKSTEANLPVFHQPIDTKPLAVSIVEKPKLDTQLSVNSIKEEIKNPEVKVTSSSDPSVFKRNLKPSNAPNAQMLALSQYISSKYRIAKEGSLFIVSESFRIASQHRTDPYLVLSVIANESSFNPLAASSVGAVGLMQALPKAHPEKIDSLKKSKGHILNISDNLSVGVRILKEYLDASDGNVVYALQRYNGNPNDRNHRYASKILSLQHAFQKISGVTPPQNKDMTKKLDFQPSNSKSYTRKI